MVKRFHTISLPQREPVKRCEQQVNVRVRLIRKLAERVNGVDLSKVRVGDTFDVPFKDARILIGEGWAVEIDPRVDIAAK